MVPNPNSNSTAHSQDDEQHIMTEALESALYHIELGFPDSHDVLKTKIRAALNSRRVPKPLAGEL